MNFEKFWKEYKEERDSIPDYGWEEMLLRLIHKLNSSDQKVVIHNLLKFIKTEEDDWYVSLAAVERFGNDELIEELSDLLLKLDYGNDNSRYGYILKVVTIRKPNNKFISDFIEKAKIDSTWKYIVKNLPDKLSDLFVEAFDRYFSEFDELGFDLKTYLGLRNSKMEMLILHFRDDKKITKCLDAIQR